MIKDAEEIPGVGAGTSINILKEVENDIKVWIGVQKRVVTMMLTGMTDYSDIT